MALASPRAHLRVVAPLHDPEQGDSDATLVVRARAGEAWALEALYRRHVQLVAGTALRLLRHRAEAEDVTQETFLLAFEKLGQLAEPAAFRGWLVRITVSRVHRRFRARRLRALFFVRERDGDDEVGLADDAAQGASPEDRTELALLDRALLRLPLPLRTAWTVRHVLGCSVEETAEACACSLATIKRRIAAADEQLHAHLEGAS
jgi:RNA polymerase sigma-70 factor (ECF subfamily)